MRHRSDLLGFVQTVRGRRRTGHDGLLRPGPPSRVRLGPGSFLVVPAGNVQQQRVADRRFWRGRARKAADGAAAPQEVTPFPLSLLSRPFLDRAIRAREVVYAVRVGDAPVEHRREPEHRFVAERTLAPRAHRALLVQHVRGQVQRRRMVLLDGDRRDGLMADVRVRFHAGRMVRVVAVGGRGGGGTGS